jgi:ornithine carbamoyltransferase
MDLYARDLITTQEWERWELEVALGLAARMKRDRFSPEFTRLLEYKTFIMFFYNPSVRTRISFEDAAKVMARFAAGIGIRILEDKVPYYGAGTELLREYAHWAKVPILNMADDRFHPFQGLADVMGWAEWYGEGPGHPDYQALEGKKFVLTWAQGALARSWCSVQEALLIASRFGMHVTLACPDGYDLDPEVIGWTRQNCEENGTTFEVTSDPAKGLDGAHVVYARNWMSPNAYQDGEFKKQGEIEKAMKISGWTLDAAKMARTDNAIFTHPMPVDRGNEVTDEVASGPRSAIYDVAENRLHVQKAVMALTMGNL